MSDARAGLHLPRPTCPGKTGLGLISSLRRRSLLRQRLQARQALLLLLPAHPRLRPPCEGGRRAGRARSRCWTPRLARSSTRSSGARSPVACRRYQSNYRGRGPRSRTRAGHRSPRSRSQLAEHAAPALEAAVAAEAPAAEAANGRPASGAQTAAAPATAAAAYAPAEVQRLSPPPVPSPCYHYVRERSRPPRHRRLRSGPPEGSRERDQLPRSRCSTCGDGASPSPVPGARAVRPRLRQGETRLAGLG